MTTHQKVQPTDHPSLLYLATFFKMSPWLSLRHPQKLNKINKSRKKNSRNKVYACVHGFGGIRHTKQTKKVLIALPTTPTACWK